MNVGRFRTAQLFRWLAPAGLGLALAVGGCADDDPLAPDNTVPPPIRNTASPAELIQAHAEALSTMDLERYAALLEQPVGRADVGFKYVPRDEDVVSLAWLPESGWNYDVEIGIMTHMMDPDFQSSETGHSVQSIQADLAVTGEQPLDGGGIEVTCSAVLMVLWGANDGASADVRFRISMFPDGDGFLRIRTIAELPAYAPRTGTTAITWGRTKSVFR